MLKGLFQRSGVVNRRLLSTKPASPRISRKDLLTAIDGVLGKGPVEAASVGRRLPKDARTRLNNDFGGLLTFVKSQSLPPNPRYKIIGNESNVALCLAEKTSTGASASVSKGNGHGSGKRLPGKEVKKGSNDLTVSTINSTMNVYAKNGDLKSCITWFKLISELGMKPDAYSLSILIRAHCQADDVSGAIKWLDVMSSEGIKPLVYHINPIIATYARKGSISNTLHWFEAMQNKYNVKPDMHTFSSVLVGYLEAGEPAKAIELFEATLHESPDLVMYNNAINCYAAANDLEGATKTFARIKEAGLKASVREYSSLIFAHARYGEGDRAEEVLQMMEEDGVMPTLHTITSVITAWSKTGNIERATFWFNRLLERGINPSNRTVNSMIYAHTQALDVAGAKYYFENMQSLYRLHPDVYSVNMIMKALLAKVPAEYDSVLKLWTAHFMHPNHGHGLGVVEGGDSNAAAPVALRPNHQSYSIIVRACRNNKKRASFWFGYMLKSGLEPDEKILKLLRSTIGEKRFVEYCRKTAERDLDTELDSELW
jgi:pentatricopeptide repeat protein